MAEGGTTEASTRVRENVAWRERLALPTSAVKLLRGYRQVTLEGSRRSSSLSADGSLPWCLVELAVVTNGEAGVQQATANVRIDSLVDACVVSDVVGIRKPDPRIFELAARLCGHPLAGAWMVGDGDADVIGANASGIRPVGLARGRRWERSDVETTAIAHSIVATLDHVTAAA